MFDCMSALSDRLREARQAAGYLRATHAAEAIGVKVPTYTSHENGTRTPDADALDHYSRRFKVSIDWLVKGRSDGFNEQSVRSAVSAMFEHIPTRALSTMAPEKAADVAIVLCRALEAHPEAPETVSNVVRLFTEQMHEAS